MPKKHRLLVGAHMSIAGGFEKAIERGESIGCSTIQIFTKSNRQWLAKAITMQEAALFQQALHKSSLHSVIVHASYLINLGSSNPETAHKSIQAVIDELKRCELLGLSYLVIHPGSGEVVHDSGGLSRIIDALNSILETTPGNTMILLETMAGQGKSLCYTFEQLASIYHAVSLKERIGICLDTCHIFAAGYDLRTEETYQALWHQFDSILGLSLLKVIHINDSKKDLGSRVDRHEDIGKGKIGSEAFRLLFNDQRFFDIPKIIETPKDDLKDDERNLMTIRQLLSPATKILLGLP